MTGISFPAEYVGRFHVSHEGMTYCAARVCLELIQAMYPWARPELHKRQTSLGDYAPPYIVCAGGEGVTLTFRKVREDDWTWRGMKPKPPKLAVMCEIYHDEHEYWDTRYPLYSEEGLYEEAWVMIQDSLRRCSRDETYAVLTEIGEIRR